MRERLGANPFGDVSINEAYFGPWVPKPELLPEALKPHVHEVNGVPSVPARLVHRVDALNKPKTQK